MEFMNRGNRPISPTTNPVTPVPTGRNRGRGLMTIKSLRIASVALLFSATILLLALVVQIAYGTPKREASFIDENKLQAVFLNGGQVYFGKITDINDQYLRLVNIFYLRVNQQVQPEVEGANNVDPNQISLVKLGCELHRPTDEMIINRAQVLFWENLKDEDGLNTVPGAVKDYIRQFPYGQECEDNAQQPANNAAPADPAAPATPTPNRGGGGVRN